MRPGSLLRWYSLRKLLRDHAAAGALVLDVGGFDGVISSLLKQQRTDLRAIVVDIDMVGLRLARKNGLGVVKGSALGLPFRDGSIDLVFCLDLIEHLRDETLLIEEVYRVLKKGGTLILSTPKEGGVHFPFLGEQANWAINRQWGHERLGYNRAELQELLTAGKFEVVHAVGFFNGFSRLFYRLFFIGRINIPFKELLFRAVVYFEPYIKIGLHEHTYVCRK